MVILTHPHNIFRITDTDAHREDWNGGVVYILRVDTVIILLDFTNIIAKIHVNNAI